jgi:hypothetical protein
VIGQTIGMDREVVRNYITEHSKATSKESETASLRVTTSGWPTGRALRLCTSLHNSRKPKRSKHF